MLRNFSDRHAALLKQEELYWLRGICKNVVFLLFGDDLSSDWLN